MTLIFLIVSVPLYAKEMIIFTGIPEMKISEGGVDRVLENLNKENAIKFKCTITKIDDKYYWTSRENIELIPISSGAFITYWAVNGSGYVRVVKPGMKEEVKRQETNSCRGVLQYSPTFRSLKRQVIKNELVLDGSLVKGKYAIVLDDRKILLSHKSFKYLFKLAWAIFKKEGGWIHKLDLEEGENQGKYIYRLKKELSLADGKLIENNRIGCYRLNLKKEKIQVNKKVLDNFEDYEIKKLLEEME